jgi:DNA-binding response OmpR family regulator
LFAPRLKDQSHAPPTRRALIVVDAGESVLAPALAAHGYETETANIAAAPWLIKTSAPDVVILELYQGEIGGNTEALYLARRLRTEPESYATPIVIAWSEEQETLHRAALYMGADDYFSLTTPPEQILARLDALFWRIAAGRRTATLIGDQKLEIENFVLLTDSVRWDIERGWEGTLALVQPLGRDNQPLDRAATVSALNAICGFLKLQMRRMDSAVFYDASTLLVYLPHLSTPLALGALTRLRAEFLEAQKSYDMAIGLASFPGDGNDLEELLEVVETAALQARSSAEFRRVVAYGLSRAEAVADAPPAETEAVVVVVETATPEAAEPSAPPDVEPETADSAPAEAAAPDDAPALPMPDIALPSPVEIPPPAAPVPSPPSPFTLAETISAPAPEPPVFSAPEAPAGHEPSPSGRTSSTQEIEQSLRPLHPSRLLLAVSRPERMAQLNTLVRSAGYEVRPAFDGPHALGLLRIDRPDLLLLDYEVRGLNGLETLHRIQAQHSGRLPVPVILLTAQDAPEIKAEAEALGVQKVIQIPYAPIELLAAMRQAVSQS